NEGEAGWIGGSRITLGLDGLGKVGMYGVLVILCVLFVLFQSCRVQNLSCKNRLSIGIGMQGRNMAPWIQLVSIAVDYRSAAAARRDSSVDVSSSQSNPRGFRSLGKVCGGKRS